MHRFPDRRNLQSLADGEASGGEAERLRRHVTECSSCSEELTRLERLGALIQQSRPAAEEMTRAEAAEVFHAALAQSGVLRRRKSVLWRAAWSVAGLTAAAGACFVLMPRPRAIVAHHSAPPVEEGRERARRARDGAYFKLPKPPTRDPAGGARTVREAPAPKPQTGIVVPAEPARRLAAAPKREPRRAPARPPRVERPLLITAVPDEPEAVALPHPELRVAFGRGTPVGAESRAPGRADETAVLQADALADGDRAPDAYVLAKRPRSGQTVFAAFKQPDVPLSVRVAGEETQGYARVSALRVSGTTLVRTECTVSSESPEPNVVITTVGTTSP
jgi:hypothetical protein